MSEVRLDKWLWAARFFKTRQLAKEAITGGKVHYNGAKSKVSKSVQIGATLAIRQGFTQIVVMVMGLSEVRGSATQAQQLYQETAQSVEKRELEASLRKAQKLVSPNATKPTKKQRRQIVAFKQKID